MTRALPRGDGLLQIFGDALTEVNLVFALERCNIAPSRYL